MLFFPLNIEEKIAISILGEEIGVSWSLFYSIIAFRGKYWEGLEMLLSLKLVASRFNEELRTQIIFNFLA